MKRLLIAAVAVTANLSAYSQVTPGASINPFTVDAAPTSLPTPMTPALSKQAAIRQVQAMTSAQPMPTPMPDDGVPAEFKPMIDGAVLIGRTESLAILGFPVSASNTNTVAGQTRQLKTYTVKNGGTFYLGQRKLKLVLDEEGNGASVVTAGGSILLTLEIESPRSITPAHTQNDQPGSAGTGIGQLPMIGSSSGGSLHLGQNSGQQPNGIAPFPGQAQGPSTQSQ